MNLEKLTPFAIAAMLFASSKISLIDITNRIRKAEFQLIQDSKASKWPNAPLLKISKNRLSLPIKDRPH